jgi:hypothetical protein
VGWLRRPLRGARLQSSVLDPRGQLLRAALGFAGCSMPSKGWRATFYTTGMEHSHTSATVTAWERTPWRSIARPTALEIKPIASSATVKPRKTKPRLQPVSRLIGPARTPRQ